MFAATGDRPQWQAIYERLEQMEIGDVIRDPELAEAVPDASPHSIRSAFWRAVTEVEDNRRRTFARVRLVGYRMVAAADHAALARKHHRRAGRQLRSAWRKASSADRSLLSHEERRRVDDLEMNLARQRDFIARLDRRLNSEVRERKSEVAHISERVDQLAALLERHGIKFDATTTHH